MPETPTPFTSLEEALADPEAVKFLDLREQSLRELDPRIGEFTQLEILFLSGNFLDDLPDTLQNCTQLRTLALNKNVFTGIPYVLSGLQSLENLTLAGNDLYMIPTDISALYNLKKLNVSGNKLPPDEQRKLVHILPHTEIVLHAGARGKHIPGSRQQFVPVSPGQSPSTQSSRGGANGWRIAVGGIALGLFILRILFRLLN